MTESKKTAPRFVRPDPSVATVQVTIHTDGSPVIAGEVARVAALFEKAVRDSIANNPDVIGHDLSGVSINVVHGDSTLNEALDHYRALLRDQSKVVDTRPIRVVLNVH